MASYNEEALEQFVRSPVSSSMIRYLALKATQVIRCEPIAGCPTPPTPPSTPPTDKSTQSRRAQPSPVPYPATRIPTLESFIASLCKSSNVQVPTLMTTLLYLDRLRAVLPPVAKGLPCTVHRIFLACLILSAKFLNDSSPKNKHWALYSHVHEGFGFSKTEVNLMEKQLLFLLDWNLNFTTSDLEQHFEVFLAPIRQEIETIELYKRAQREKRRAHESKLEHQRMQLQEQSRQYSYAPSIPVPRIHKSGPYSRAGSYSRHPTASPPSASDVPGLSRSGTEESIASSYRKTSSNYSSQTPSRSCSQERESVRSLSTTPSSSIYNMSLQQQADYYAPEPLFDADSMFDGATWCQDDRSIEPVIADDYHTVNDMSMHSFPAKQQPKASMRSFAAYTGGIAKAPVLKKAKMSGFMSRFRNTAEA